MIRHRQRGGPPILLLLVALAVVSLLRADPAPPPAPAGYFTDRAGVVDAATGLRINEQLAQFERDTSNQILVAIYPSLPEGADPAQFATQTYRAWGVGQKGTSLGQKGANNGAILFVWVNDRKLFISTGRGLEGALPDATCKNIIDGQIVPRFKQGDFTGGVQAGVNAMLAAARGEYVGTGQTQQERQGLPNRSESSGGQGLSGWIVLAIILILIFSRLFTSGYGGSPYIFTGGGYQGGFGGGRDTWGGGGNGGDGGGGFSGGGGSSSGGGAGGSW